MSAHGNSVHAGRGMRAGTRRMAIAVSVVVVAAGASSCAASGVTGPASVAMSEETSGPVYLGVTDDAVQQRLEGRYRSALESADRDVEVRDVTTSDRLDKLHNGEVSVVIGCVGELLDELDPVKGQELRGLYAEAQEEEEEGIDAAQWRDIAHSTMFSALPTDLQASDPGEVSACDDDSLPQNFVAVYRKTALERADRRALNNVAGGVSDDDIAEESAEGS
ncbi:hypothetical protein ACT3SZ_11535 [Corynebacterium sp. AOP40-9SA-29]|uniref:hypothetical protein n=1 Tax=Corynebacterium sp. AOP40-9SA-29 TaxID=3457677 RepID=UPI004034AF2A